MIWITDEFGVYSYSEIVSAGWPTIIGHPGENATATQQYNTRDSIKWELFSFDRCQEFNS